MRIEALNIFKKYLPILLWLLIISTTLQLIIFYYNIYFTVGLLEALVRSTIEWNIVAVITISAYLGYRHVRNRILRGVLLIVSPTLVIIFVAASFFMVISFISLPVPKRQYMLLGSNNQHTYFVATDRRGPIGHLHPYFYKERSIGIPGINKREIVTIDEIKAVNLYSDSLYARFNEHYFQKY